MQPDTGTAEPPEVTQERIYDDLKAYADGGMIDYVLPTDPIGEQWIVGHNGQILTFDTKEGIVGFLTGIQVGALFAARVQRKLDPLTRLQVEHARKCADDWKVDHPRQRGECAGFVSRTNGLLEIIDSLAVPDVS